MHRYFGSPFAHFLGPHLLADVFAIDDDVAIRKADIKLAGKLSQGGFILPGNIVLAGRQRNESPESCFYDTAEHIEIFREGLGHAAGIIDGDCHASQRYQRKTHGHAVIVIGINSDIGC